jgi:transcriptional antiterminator RfaH
MWYVIRTKPKAEYIAAAELESDGFEVFLPLLKTPTPRPGHLDAPVFPGYLFLQWGAEDGWPAFLPRHRVVGFVRFEEVVPSVPDAVVAELSQRLELLNQAGGSWRRFSPGEKVRFNSRGMDNLIAEVLEGSNSPERRVKVLVRFMGRLVSTEVPWKELLPIEDDHDGRPRPPRRTRGGGRWIRGFGPHAVAYS